MGREHFTLDVIMPLVYWDWPTPPVKAYIWTLSLAVRDAIERYNSITRRLLSYFATTN